MTKLSTNSSLTVRPRMALCLSIKLTPGALSSSGTYPHVNIFTNSVLLNFPSLSTEISLDGQKSLSNTENFFSQSSKAMLKVSDTNDSDESSKKVCFIVHVVINNYIFLWHLDSFFPNEISTHKSCIFRFPFYY